MSFRFTKIKNVSTKDSYLTNALDKEIEYLLSFDVQRLLSGFYQNAGLPVKAPRYGGWEDSLIGGHCVGHYMSALTQAYNSPDISDKQRDRAYDILVGLCKGFEECQNKVGTGLIWGAKSIGNIEAQFDNVEREKTNIIKEAWVPYYTLHKLIAGLCSIYNLTGIQIAKTVVSRLSDWVYRRTETWTEEVRKNVLSVEYGGIGEALFDVFSITRKKIHFTAACAFMEEDFYDKVLSQGKDILDDLHANTTIPKILCALRRYEISGERRYFDVSEKFWDIVINRHTYVTGGHGEWEHYGKDFILDGERTECNCETCCAYNMLILSRKLFSHTGEKKYLDYYERTYINSILSSQNPETGMTTYFQPMGTGYFKVYSSPYDHFWCCTGSGMESFSKLCDSMFYLRDDGAVCVAMYFDSVYSTKQGSVQVKADLLGGGRVQISCSSPTKLMLRIPDWAKSYSVNCDAQKEGGFIVIDGAQEVELQFEMTLERHSLPDNDRAFAFTYGPFVLSAVLSDEDMVQTTTGVIVSIPERRIPKSDVVLTDVSVEDYFADSSRHILQKGNSFIFTDCAPQLVFTPHFYKHGVRYGIYFRFYGKDEQTTDVGNGEKIDFIQPGYGQYECDELHDMREENSYSQTGEETFRANCGGYFEYDVKVDTSADNSLLVILAKKDNGKSLKISAGQDVVCDIILDYTGEEEKYTLSFPLGGSVIAGNAFKKGANARMSDVVTIRFEGDAPVRDKILVLAK